MLRTLDDYVGELHRVGYAEFSFIYGKPALLGMGVLGDLCKSQGPAMMATHMAVIPTEAPQPAGESLFGRIWLLQKDHNTRPGPSIDMGRGPRNDIVIPEHSLSRLHVSFRADVEAIYLADRRSRNGTYVNDKRLEPEKFVRLADGDMLRLGRLLCTFMSREGFLETVTQMHERRYPP